MSHSRFNILLSLNRDIVLNILSNWINIFDLVSLDNALLSTHLRSSYINLGVKSYEVRNPAITGRTSYLSEVSRLTCNISVDQWSKYQHKTEILFCLFDWLKCRGFGLKTLVLVTDICNYAEVLRNVEYLHACLNQQAIEVINWSRIYLLDVQLLIKATSNISSILEFMFSCKSLQSITLRTQYDQPRGLQILNLSDDRV